MARAPVESLVDRRYRHDMAEWGAWQQHQARLRRLAGRALDALEKALDDGGPEATRAATTLLRMAATANEPRKPDRFDFSLLDDDELAAGLIGEAESVDT